MTALITRRRLIVGTVLAGGGLAVGYLLSPFGTLDRARKLVAKGDEALLTGWVKIAPDNTVTVVVPHSEMGQGVHTSLPMMAAEELDADWALVKMEQAPADMAFANWALGREYLRGDATIPTFLTGTANFVSRKLTEFMNLQITGGSTSVRMTGVGMRYTGAAARWMLIQAAAAEWGVPDSEIVAKKSMLTHPSGKSATFGQMAAKAADYDPPTNLPLKSPSDYTIVKTAVQRFDIPAKVDGSAKFGTDTRVPGMMFAAVKVSPVFGGSVKGFTSAVVHSRPGVKAVVEVPNGVAVVADNYWRAKQALDLLPIEWNEGAGAAHTSQSIVAGMNAALDKGEFETDWEFGDVETALKGAKTTVEASYQVPYLAHACMEPMNCTAHFKDGKLEVWGGFQDGLGARAAAAQFADISMENVTLHHTAMGGGFGRRIQQLDPESRLPKFSSQGSYLEQAILIAKQVEFPVNLIWSREEDLSQDNYRNASVARVKAGVDAEGKPTAWVYDFTEKHDPPDATWLAYGIADRRARYVNGTDPVPFGPWRSVDNSHHAFFIESFIDELAHAAGKDPVAYRVALLADSPRHKAAVEAVSKMAGWDTPAAEGRARGISLKESFGTIVAEVAEVSIGEDGRARVHKVWCVADPGEVVHPDGFKAQMESGIIYGLTAALYGEISIDKGRVVEQNFPDYDMVRMADAPAIEVQIIESGARTGGAGEPGTPPIAAAVANAVFSLTGQRIRSLPLRKHDLRKGIVQARA
jgi:isoquinoline 1-oxidoreductase beta subunit